MHHRRSEGLGDPGMPGLFRASASAESGRNSAPASHSAGVYVCDRRNCLDGVHDNIAQFRAVLVLTRFGEPHLTVICLCRHFQLWILPGFLCLLGFSSPVHLVYLVACLRMLSDDSFAYRIPILLLQRCF